MLSFGRILAKILNGGGSPRNIGAKHQHESRPYLSLVPVFLSCFLVDLLVYGILGRAVGTGPFLANTAAMSLAGIVALAVFWRGSRPSGVIGRRRPLLCLLWVALAAPVVGQLLRIWAAQGHSLLPAKVLAALAFAALTPMVFRRLLTGRDGKAVQFTAAGLGVLAAGLLGTLAPPAASRDSGEGLGTLYATPRTPPDRPLRVFHLGHSLVARDMPAMLAQLAGKGHRYESQLGWATSLREHYEPDLTINGFAQENDHPRYRDAHEALASGEYDVFVMTEMVTLADAIRYHDSADYAARWAGAAVAGNPDIQVFLYETWHSTQDSPDWLTRLPGDLDEWKGHLLWPAARATGKPIHLIPAGQAMAQLVAQAEATPDGIAELKSRHDLFAISPDGERDPIHLNDLGNYLVALTHYAAIYGESPVGLPHELLRADGSPARAPSAELARRMQETAWAAVQETEASPE